MFNSSQTLRVIFSVVSLASLLAATVAAQDKPSGGLSTLDSVMSSILKQNLLRVPKEPEDAGVKQESLIDFTRTTLMNPVGLIPAPDRGVGVMAPDVNRTASGVLHITLEEAQARAVSTQTIIQLFSRRPLLPTITRAVPLLAKDETIVLATVTQPLTPLFKVHQAVRIARADERIARAKANALATHLTADVERAYFELLIAQRRQTEAEAHVEIAERKLQIASAATTLPDGPAGIRERQAALLEAEKALLAASDKLTESTNSFTDLTGFPDDARFELDPPPPLVETYSSTQKPQPVMQKPQPVIAYRPEIVEAEEAVVKARAAHRLAKLEYVPDVAIFGGYTFQTAIPALPDDFSFIGVIASYTLFDFGKRERTVKERRAQVSMAKANLELVRAKVAAGAQKTVMDPDRTRRILELTRQVVSMQRAAMPRDQDPGPEARAALAKVESEMFQAELDHRIAYTQFKRVMGEE